MSLKTDDRKKLTFPEEVNCVRRCGGNVKMTEYLVFDKLAGE